MKKITSIAIALFLISSISSCAFLEGLRSDGPLNPDHLKKGPQASIKGFFDGDVEGFAITQDDYGNINGTETIELSGSWEENKGVLRQTFRYRDGKKDARTWLITVNKDNTFDAVGHDVAGPAKGVQMGNAIQMAYTLLLPEEGRKVEVKYKDTMYLVNEDSMIMISEFKRRGGQSGKSIISLKKKQISATSNQE